MDRNKAILQIMFYVLNKNNERFHVPLVQTVSPRASRPKARSGSFGLDLFFGTFFCSNGKRKYDHKTQGYPMNE